MAGRHKKIKTEQTVKQPQPIEKKVVEVKKKEVTNPIKKDEGISNIEVKPEIVKDNNVISKDNHLMDNAESANVELEGSSLFEQADLMDSPMLNQPMIERRYAMANPAIQNQEQGQTETATNLGNEQTISNAPKFEAIPNPFNKTENTQSPLSEPASNAGSDTPKEFSWEMPMDGGGGATPTEGGGGSLEADNGGAGLPEMPTQNAKQIADFILGTANFIVPLIGGRFVTVKIHKEYYEFNTFVETINSQNQRNIERIKLTKDEIDYLKPILVAVIKEKHTQLTPTTQLLVAVGMIGAGKVATIMDIKRENAQLEEKLIDIIRASKTNEPKVDTNPSKETKK
jgi:hypothetical protein